MQKENPDGFLVSSSIWRNSSMLMSSKRSEALPLRKLRSFIMFVVVSFWLAQRDDDGGWLLLFLIVVDAGGFVLLSV